MPETATAEIAITDQTQPAGLYPLDQQVFEIAVNAKRGERTIKTVHQLRRPTLPELIERDKQSSYQSEDLNSSESKTLFDLEGPNAKLYDKLIQAVQGYKPTPQSRSEERLKVERDEKGNPTSNWLGSIPASHKATAIAGMYVAKYVIKDDEEEEGFVLDGGSWTIKQLIGPNEDDPIYTITHTLRSPTEKERREYNRSSADVFAVKGSRRSKQKIVTNLKPFVTLYDQLIQSLDGVSVQNRPFSLPDAAAFIAAVDPIFKQKVIATLMAAFEGSLSD